MIKCLQNAQGYEQEKSNKIHRIFLFLFLFGVGYEAPMFEINL